MQNDTSQLHANDRVCAQKAVLHEPLAMQVLILGGNPAGQANAFEEHVAKARAARPSLDIAWQASDPGQTAT